MSEVDGADKKGRGQWDNHCEFFLSSLGLAVGLGNIWRFPYIAYSNGGATFLIPYVLMLFLVGLPMFLIELTIGQYAGLSCTKIFKNLVPGMRGLGYSMILQTGLMAVYYIVIMAHAVFYLANGLTLGELPWARCQADFTAHCYSLKDQAGCKEGQTFFDLKCLDHKDFCVEFDLIHNDNGCKNESSGEVISIDDVTYRTSPTEDFFYRRMLNLAVNKELITNEDGEEVYVDTLDTELNSFSNFGSPRWQLVACLAFCWLVVCLSLIKGIQSYGKVVYFTTLFPYVVLTVVIGYSATLEGFIDGVQFYVVPKDFDKLLDVSVWHQAASQIFYSLSLGVGNQLLLASFNDFRSNVFRDALLIGISNSATSLYAGVAVFGVLGYMAKVKGVEVEDVVAGGPGLAFVVYPEAVTFMEFAPFVFSFLFFFMLCLLAISSVCGMWETVVAALSDEFEVLRRHRVLTMIITCSIAFLLGLPMVFDSGFLVLDLMDSRSANALLLLAFLELILMSWVYGANKILGHLKDMEVKIPSAFQFYFKIAWMFITPGIILVVSVISYSGIESLSEFGYVYPWPIQAFGWVVELLALSVTFVVAIFTAFKAGFNPSKLFKPSSKWGPRPDSGLVADGNTNTEFDNPVFEMTEKTRF